MLINNSGRKILKDIIGGVANPSGMEFVAFIMYPKDQPTSSPRI